MGHNTQFYTDIDVILYAAATKDVAQQSCSSPLRFRQVRIDLADYHSPSNNQLVAVDQADSSLQMEPVVFGLAASLISSFP